jgi:hypothetical protein
MPGRSNKYDADNFIFLRVKLLQKMRVWEALGADASYIKGGEEG